MRSDSNNENSASARARASRVRQFAELLSSCGLSGASILDIGGTAEYWKMNAQYIPEGLVTDVDVVNITSQDKRTETAGSINLHFYEGNALDVSSLRLGHYDVVHSNSVIEHIGGFDKQREMAEGIQNICQYYWVQTPAKSFPLEPHFYFPFFAYLPLAVRSKLHQHISLGFMGKQQDPIKARQACEEIRLLTRHELGVLFPKGVVLKERLCLMVKSFIATNMVHGS